MWRDTYPTRWDETEFKRTRLDDIFILFFEILNDEIYREKCIDQLDLAKQIGSRATRSRLIPIVYYMQVELKHDN